MIQKVDNLNMQLRNYSTIQQMINTDEILMREWSSAPLMLRLVSGDGHGDGHGDLRDVLAEACGGGGEIGRGGEGDGGGRGDDQELQASEVET